MPISKRKNTHTPSKQTKKPQPLKAGLQLYLKVAYGKRSENKARSKPVRCRGKGNKMKQQHQEQNKPSSKLKAKVLSSGSQKKKSQPKNHH